MKQCSGQPSQKAEYILSLRHHDSGSQPTSRPAASCASQKAIARSAVYLANQPTPRFRTFLHAHHATNVPQFSSAALPRSTTSHPRFPHDDGLTLASRLLCLPSAPTTRQHLNIFRTTNPHLSPHTLDKDLRTPWRLSTIAPRRRRRRRHHVLRRAQKSTFPIPGRAPSRPLGRLP